MGILLTDNELLEAFDSTPDFQVQCRNLAKAQLKKLVDEAIKRGLIGWAINDKTGERVLGWNDHPEKALILFREILKEIGEGK